MSNSAVFSFFRQKKVMSYPVEYRTCWETMKRWRSSLVPSPTLNAWMLLKIGWESQDTPHFLRRGAAFHLTPSTLVSTTSLLILLPLDYFLLVPLATTQRWRSQEWNQCQVSMSKAMAHRTPSTWPKIDLWESTCVCVLCVFVCICVCEVGREQSRMGME